MSPTDEAWNLFYNLMRQYPLWPTTFSACECGRGQARGGGRCVLCAEEALAAKVGPELAAQARTALERVPEAWGAIRRQINPNED